MHRQSWPAVLHTAAFVPAEGCQHALQMHSRCLQRWGLRLEARQIAAHGRLWASKRRLPAQHTPPRLLLRQLLKGTGPRQAQPGQPSQAMPRPARPLPGSRGPARLRRQCCGATQSAC